MTLKTERCTFYLVLMLLALCSCGSGRQIAPTLTPPPVTVQVSQPGGFALWLADFKREAIAKGITQPVLDDAFANIKAPSEIVLTRDHTQPEKTVSFDAYLKGVLAQRKIDAASGQWQSHDELLKKVQKSYNVPAPFLLALWGVESGFGKHQGNFSIVQSLATLAYDGRRSAFFRKELLDALIILQQEHMTSQNLTGSWAGAMGQTQFMPSSFLTFAVDFDGDGKKDIWASDADALASMANYLHTKGWDDHQGWGFCVRLPRHAEAAAWAASKEQRTFRQWQKLGVRRAHGAHLPRTMDKARLVMPDNDPANAYLVTPNYDVIMDWNHSTYFATAIGLLADAIERAGNHAI